VAPVRKGDLTQFLKDMVARLGLGERVHFLGAIAPEALHKPLSASDVFVLSTANEGWANVFLEAMACGLPVVTTDVGGNAEVVCDESLGSITPFGDANALQSAIAERWRASGTASGSSSTRARTAGIRGSRSWIRSSRHWSGCRRSGPCPRPGCGQIDKQFSVAGMARSYNNQKGSTSGHQ
jgi:glycosyltransferase involved in cell wall biosynthesis